MNIDPAVFRPEAISDETRQFNERLVRELEQAPPLTGQQPQAVRDARREGRSWRGPIVHSDRATERVIDGPGGDLTLRVFEPDTIRGVYLHIHGGGWVLGSADKIDADQVRLADANDVAVVSVEYRLAPEHPYPAGPDDCEAAAFWLVEHALSAFGTDQIIIGGESAGAHLSVVTLLRLRDRHGISPFRGANLVYGAYDLSMTPSCATWGDENLVLSTPIVEWFVDHFLPDTDRRDPDISPLFADLRDMPPALFSVGTLDPLLDDSLFMASRWAAARNDTNLAIYPGGVHGFNLMPMESDITRQFDTRVDGFFEKLLAG
ncbi:N/A [soil metagenome]